MPELTKTTGAALVTAARDSVHAGNAPSSSLQQPDDPMWVGGKIVVPSGLTVAEALQDYRANLLINYGPPFATTCLRLGYLDRYTGTPTDHPCRHDATAPCTCGERQPAAKESPAPENIPSLSDAAFALIDDAMGLSQRKRTTNRLSWHDAMTALMRLAITEGPMRALGAHYAAIRSRL